MVTTTFTEIEMSLNPIAQLERIRERASIALQAFASGEDSEFLVTTFLSAVASIYVECHDPDLPEQEKIAAYSEVCNDAVENRLQNVNVFHHF